MNKKNLLIIFIILFSYSVYSIDYVLPTKIYGQILVKDKPIEGFEVTAHYLDIQNELKSVTTYTLNKQEARQNKDLSLTGYYFFDDIRALPNTNIIIDISQTNHNFIVPANPGYAVKITSFSLNLEYSPIYTSNISVLPVDDDKEENNLIDLITMSNSSSIENYTEIQTSKTINISEINKKEPETVEEDKSSDIDFTPSKDKSKSKIVSDIFNAVFIIFLIVGGGFVLYFLIKFSANYVSSAVSNITMSPSKSSAKKILNKKIREFSNPAEKISKNASFTDALNKIVSGKIGVLFVVDENSKCIGKISEEEIFNIDIESVDFSNLKVSDFMSVNVSLIENDKTLEEAYFMMNEEDIDFLGVTDNGNLEAQISILDLLKQTSHYKGSPSQSDNIRYVMTKKFFSIDKKLSIKKAKELMNENNTSFLIALDEKNPVGIFTKKDYVESLLKYQKNIFKNNIEHVMSSSIASIIPDIDILKANSIIIEKGYKNYPVKYENKIQGLITQKIVCDLVISLMQKEISN